MIRVFPRKTKWTPNDELAFVGDPPLFRPPDQAVRISVTFTWDLFRAKMLHQAWNDYYSDVKVGGPALGDPGGEFEPGRFIKEGITITSRGCNNKCSWCLVPKREGKLRELKIKPGYIIEDNNLLQCSRKHIEAVFEMLKEQNEPINFAGGLDARLLKEWHIKLFDTIKINQIWFSCDLPHHIQYIYKIAPMLSHYPLNKKRCYVLVGYNGENQEQAELRLNDIFNIGFLPFAQHYRAINDKHTDPRWAKFLKKWCRPAAIKAKGGKS